MAVSYKDYYKILGVAKTADLKAIKQAYRRLARKHHPDQNPGNPAAIERFKEATEAYEVLSDPEKRRRYDELGPDWARQAERASEGAPRGGFEDLGGFRVHVGRDADLGGFSDFFRTFFGDLGRRAGADPESAAGGDFFRGGGRGRRGARGASRGDDLEGAVEISLEEAAQGSRRIVEFQSAQVCRTCGGTGRQAEAVCPTCQGQRLNAQARAVRVGGKTLVHACALPIGELAAWKARGRVRKAVKWYRRAAKQGNLDAYGVWDKEAGKEQWRYAYKHAQDNLAGGFRAVVDVEDFSNLDFFRRFSSDPRLHTLSQIYSSAYLTKNQPTYSLNILTDRRDIVSVASADPTVPDNPIA